MAVFSVDYDTGRRGLSTLFQHRYFTIDKERRKTWDYEHLEQYLISYRLDVAPGVLEAYKDDGPVLDMLNQLAEGESCFQLTRNEGSRYGGEKQYIRCRVPIYVLKRLKNLLVSTLVYDACGRKTPEPERITFTFDSDAATVTVTELTLYRPKDNPYFLYARSAAATLSVEAIGLDGYAVAEKDIKDFYDHSIMSGWRERAHLAEETAIEDKPGVYMLYDANRNTFYVGKAIRLLERMLQHAANPDDPIPGFTHYRYSAISGAYYEFLYLIENAAIHDAAWLLDMPRAQKYKPALARRAGELGQRLEECEMVNTREHQTRKQN